MPGANEDNREKFLRYIADSQRVQRRVAVVVAVMVLASLVGLVVNASIGGLMLLGTFIFGGCSFWVTAAHIADWRLKLRTLDQNPHSTRVRITRKR